MLPSQFHVGMQKMLHRSIENLSQKISDLDTPIEKKFAMEATRAIERTLLQCSKIQEKKHIALETGFESHSEFEQTAKDDDSGLKDKCQKSAMATLETFNRLSETGRMPHLLAKQFSFNSIACLERLVQTPLLEHKFEKILYTMMERVAKWTSRLDNRRRVYNVGRQLIHMFGLPNFYEDKTFYWGREWITKDLQEYESLPTVDSGTPPFVRQGDGVEKNTSTSRLKEAKNDEPSEDNGRDMEYEEVSFRKSLIGSDDPSLLVSEIQKSDHENKETLSEVLSRDIVGLAHLFQQGIVKTVEWSEEQVTIEAYLPCPFPLKSGKTTGWDERLTLMKIPGFGIYQIQTGFVTVKGSTLVNAWISLAMVASFFSSLTTRLSLLDEMKLKEMYLPFFPNAHFWSQGMWELYKTYIRPCQKTLFLYDKEMDFSASKKEIHEVQSVYDPDLFFYSASETNLTLPRTTPRMGVTAFV